MRIVHCILLTCGITLTALISFAVHLALWNVSDIDVVEQRTFLALAFTALSLGYLGVRRWLVRDISTFFLPAWMLLGMSWALHVAMACVLDSGLMLGMDLSSVAALVALAPIFFIVLRYKNSMVSTRQNANLLWQWWVLAATTSWLYHFAPLLALIGVSASVYAVVATQWGIVLIVYSFGWWIHHRAMRHAPR